MKNEVGDYRILENLKPFLISVHWWNEIEDKPYKELSHWFYLLKFKSDDYNKINSGYCFTEEGLKNFIILINNLYKHDRLQYFPSKENKR